MATGSAAGEISPTIRQVPEAGTPQPVGGRTFNFTMTTPTEMPVPGSDPPGIEPTAAPTTAQEAAPAATSQPARQPLINPPVAAAQLRMTELECMVQQLRADPLLLKTEFGKPDYKAPNDFELKQMDW